MTKQDFINTLNRWGREQIPFLFVIDFEFEKPTAIRLDELGSENIQFSFPGFKHCKEASRSAQVSLLQKRPESFELYQKKFNSVFAHLNYGDSYLTNLTVKTEIGIQGDFDALFHAARAPYKLLFRDEFLVFSPESFVKIREGKIYSYPMKGTIDAATDNASQTILSDPKELAEHVTIVDLIRNDLSQVAHNVRVNRFRYIEEINTNSKNLLQVSSEIVGDLQENFRHKLGDLLAKLLPAGSVSGAPKPKTLEIIAEAEGEPRGYYTGIFGYFDGTDLDSAVMIRFIERDGDNFFYRSGGGITTQSSASLEYQEVIDKVYLPVG